MKQISLTELQRVLASEHPPTLLEVRPERYFNEGHLPGARHFPLDALEGAASVLPDRDAPLVLYCASNTCANSHRAAAALVARGYSNVAVFPGGKLEWTDAGLAFERASLGAE